MVKIHKIYTVIIEFSNTEKIKREIHAKDRDEAFTLLYETSNNGWLTTVNGERDIHYNINNAIKVTIVDEEEEDRKLKEYAKSLM